MGWFTFGSIVYVLLAIFGANLWHQKQISKEPVGVYNHFTVIAHPHGEPHNHGHPHVDTAEANLLEDVQTKLNSLATQMDTKYPALADIHTLSASELLKRYPTEEAQRLLREQIEQMESEYFELFRQLILQLPLNIQIQALSHLEDYACENWGEEVSLSVLTEMMANIEKTKIDERGHEHE